MAGRILIRSSNFSSETFIDNNTFPLASMTPNNRVLISPIAFLFSGSFHESLLAKSLVDDSKIMPIILKRFFLKVSPVSVRSITTSISSGTFASEAPYEK